MNDAEVEENEIRRSQIKWTQIEKEQGSIFQKISWPRIELNFFVIRPGNKLI